MVKARPSTLIGSMEPPIRALCVVAALSIGACAGPLDSERSGFERWSELAERRDTPAPSARKVAVATRDNVKRRDRFALPDAPTLDDYPAHAVAHNPGLEAAFYEWKAALERIPQARALMDPQLSYSYGVHAMDVRQTLGLARTFPWYG